jgi:predicted MFS family arabinose efflux permease
VTAERDARGWGRLTLFFACNVLFGAGLFAHGLLYNFYLDQLGVREGVMGGAAAALTAGGLTMLWPAGRLVDRVGAGASYLLAALLTTSGLVLGAFTRTSAAIYTAAFLAGAGTAAWRVAMGPLVMRLAALPHRARVFSWNVALLLASGALWTAGAGAAPRWLERWFGLSALAGIRGGLIAGALGTFVAGLLFLLLATRMAKRQLATAVDASAPEHGAVGAAFPVAGDFAPGAPLRGGRGVLIPLDLARTTLIVAVWMMAGGMVIPFFNLFFLRAHGLPVERVGVLLGAAQAVTALVVMTSGDVAARLGPRRVLVFWTLLLAPLLWLLGAGGGLTLAIALFVLQGLVPPATNPLIDQLMLERAARERQGEVSTWRNAATELAGLAGAAAGGALLQATSFRVLFFAAGVVAAAGAAGLYFGFLRSETRPRMSRLNLSP